MSDLPRFLSKSAPTNPIVIHGNELSSDEVSYLQTQINALHFRPTIVVLDSHYHVQDGNAMVADLAKAWSMGPHGMIVMYSPADKEIWSSCGTFNTSAGVDPSFFKHDFSQRMGMGNREGSLSAALNASLQDVDSVVVRSQGAATQAVTHPENQAAHLLNADPASRHSAKRFEGPQKTHATQQQQPHHHHSSGQAGAGVIGVIFQAIFFAIFILVFIGRIMGKASPRKRFDDPSQAQGLSSDVERILRVMQVQDGSGTGSGGVVRQRDTQIPMAEFQKRSTARQATARSGNSDHAANLQSAIDSSAAQVREEHKRKVANGISAQTSAAAETPVAVVQDGKFIDSYVASFGPGASKNETIETSATPAAPAKTNNPTPSYSLPPRPAPAPPRTPPSALGQPAPVQPGPPQPAAPKPLPTTVCKPAPDMNIPVVMPAVAGYSSGSSAGGSLDLTPFSLEAASAPFADVLSSMGSTLGDMKTNAGGSLPLGSLSSFDASTTGSAAPAIACPKCSEPKLKDFSFCLKCGHSF